MAVIKGSILIGVPVGFLFDLESKHKNFDILNEEENYVELEDGKPDFLDRRVELGNIYKVATLIKDYITYNEAEVTQLVHFKMIRYRYTVVDFKYIDNYEVENKQKLLKFMNKWKYDLILRFREIDKENTLFSMEYGIMQKLPLLNRLFMKYITFNRYSKTRKIFDERLKKIKNIAESGFNLN